jgi:hypothetical protein
MTRRNMMKLSNRFVVVILLAIVLVGGATWALANDDNTIYACVSPAGMVRIVSDPTECRQAETPYSWNMEGPQGPPGEDGPQGEKGDPGDPVGFYTVVNKMAEGLGGEADCDPGDSPTGGGYDRVRSSHVVRTCPTTTGWEVELDLPEERFHVWVVCADFPPYREDE